MAYENIRLEFDEALATLVIDRPKALNAFNSRALQELDQALRFLAHNSQLRALIVTGGGEKAFGQGRAVFRVRAAASHSVIRKEINGAFDYDIAPFPGKTRGQPGVTIVSGNPHTVSKTTKYPEQSYQFIRWLAGDDVQGFWAKEKIQLPTLKKWQAEFTSDKNVHTHVFADAYKVPYGIHFRHNATQRHYSEYSAEMNNEVLAGKKTMSDSLKQMTQRMNNEIETGPCMPYKGLQVPIKPA